ncbi:MAG: anti-sigma factor family protein [Candidatus Brocadiia bacterium]
MTSRQAREELSAYLDDELDEATRRAADAALEADPRLREELEALRRTVALVRSLPRRHAPCRLVARVRAALTRGSGRRYLVALAAVAVVALGLGVALLASRPGRRPSARQVHEAPAAREAAPPSQTTTRHSEERDDAADAALADRSEGTQGEMRSKLERRRPSPAAPGGAGVARRELAAKSKALRAREPAPVVREAGRTDGVLWAHDGLVEAIRKEAEGPWRPAAGGGPPAASEAQQAAPRPLVLDRRYADLDQCVAGVQTVLEGAGLSYVVQPLGAGRFILEVAAEEDDAATIAAALGSRTVTFGAAQAPAEQRAEPSGSQLGHRAVQAIEGAEGGRVHLVVRFEPRGAGAPAEAEPLAPR